MVYGYDEAGYYYSGPGVEDRAGPKPWQELGNTGIGAVELYQVRPTAPKEPAVVVKESFQKIIGYSRDHPDNRHQVYATGIKGYDLWINGLNSGKASRFGMGYNAVVWAECRRYAVDFLEGAKQRLGNKVTGLFEQALVHYREVSRNLKAVAEAYPYEHLEMGGTIEPDAACQRASGQLRAARDAEACGLAVLENIIPVL